MATSRSNVTRLKVGLLGAAISWTDNIQDRFANEYMIRRVRAEAYCTVAGTLYLKESDSAAFSAPTTLQTISVSASVTIELPWTLLTKRYYRLEYTNGGSAQTALMELFMERSGRPLDDVYVPDGNDLALGATTDAAASTGGTGSVSAKLRNLSTNMNATLTAIGLTTTAISDAGGTGAVNGHLRRVTDTLGQQDGAAVITDANGRIQQYLRGLVKLIAEGTGKLIMRTAAKGATAAGDLTSKAVSADIQALHVVQAEETPAGTQLIGKVGIDQTTPGTTNLVQVGGTLPAYAAIPAVKIDQTTPGTTNLVQIGSTLPAFTAIPAVKIDQTTPGTTNLVQVGGTLPAFAATPAVTVSTYPGPTANLKADGDGLSTASVDAGQSRLWVFNGTTWDRLRSVNTGQLTVTPKGSAGSEVIGATGAAVPAGAVAIGISDGTNLRTLLGNTTATLFASAARTATSSSADQTNYNGQGVIVTIDVTLDPSTASVVFTIEAKDPVSGAYTTVLTSAAVAAVGTTRLRVGSAITASANVAAADLLGRTWRVTATHADAESITYSVSAETMTA